MKILLLFAFPIIFIACSPPKVKNQNKTETAVIAIEDFEKSLKKTDTGYKAITLKINQQDSILLKRIYFDKKDYSNYNYAFIRNGKTIYLDKKYKFIEDSKYNRLIKNGQKIFLFLEIDDRPNFNRIVAYSLFKDNLTFLVDCVYNDKKQGGGPAPFTDIDNDGFLEYGGFDVNEVPQSPDSIYYNPSEFYEIKYGKIMFDSALTKRMDIKINGVHLSSFLDKSGNCCIVLKKPK